MAFLSGWFDPITGRPLVQAFLVSQSARDMGAITFLVDTGADRGILMPMDWRRLDLNPAAVSATVGIGGIGGMANFRLEPLRIRFRADSGQDYAYLTEIALAPAEPAYSRIRSLLGRDILDRWRMVYDPMNQRLEFEILDWDESIEI
jgi:hypothetical protein